MHLFVIFYLVMTKSVVYFSAACYLLAVFFNVGVHQLDEHFQILEFANYKLGNTSAKGLAWEFDSQMRSGFQPFLVYLLHHILLIFNINNPFFETFILRFFGGLLSFLAVLGLVNHFLPQIDAPKLKKWFIYLSLLFWFLPYINVRFSGECLSASLFIFGYLTYFQGSKKGVSVSKKILFWLAAGLLLGLSFVVRFQMGLMIFGFALWALFVHKQPFGQLLMVFLGIILAIFVGTLTDFWLYDTWTVSWYNYIDQNLIEGKEADFGHYLWWWYFAETLNKATPVFGLVIVISVVYFILFSYRKHPLAWILLPFLVIHCHIGHKEMRFLFPIVNFLPIIFVLSIQFINKNYSKISYFLERYIAIWLKPLFWIVNFPLMVWLIFLPNEMDIPYKKYIFNHYKTPTILYTPIENPSYTQYGFKERIEANYYKPKNLNTIIYDTSTTIETQKNTTILFNIDSIDSRNLLIINGLKFKKVYQTMPLYWANQYPDYRYLKQQPDHKRLERPRLTTLYELK